MNNLLSGHIVQKFKSKKNQVYLLHFSENTTGPGELFVQKQYVSNPQKEYQWLHLLGESGLNVPEVIEVGEKELLLAYLPGETLCDYLIRQEELGTEVEQLVPVLSTFVQWLFGFYRISRKQESWILGDVNLRNFILHENGQVYGLDFEDCVIGKVEEDAGKICAFALTYVPVFTPWKFALTRLLYMELVRELTLDANLVKVELDAELRAIAQRRGLAGCDYQQIMKNLI